MTLDSEDSPGSSGDYERMSLLEKRLLISYYYVQVMNAPAPEHWKGWDGTIVEILRGLDMTNDGYRKVESVIHQTYKCLVEKHRYMGHIQWKGGRSNFVQPSSEEEQMMMSSSSVVQRTRGGSSPALKRRCPMSLLTKASVAFLTTC